MHLKRMSAPKSWVLDRKSKRYIVRPLPGKHSLSKSLSLADSLKVLGFASTTRSVKKSLHDSVVLVDGVRVKEYNSQVGLFDVLSVGGFVFRMILDSHGRLVLKESKGLLKPCRIVRKVSVSGGKFQIGLSDGRSLILSSSDKDSYIVGDTVLISVPDQKVEKYVRLEKGSNVLLVNGKNAGTLGSIVDVDGGVVKYSVDGVVFSTTRENSFALPEGFEV